jgi:hypothetical protein
MIPKISLAAAFLLMMAPPMACASNRDTANSVPITYRTHQSPSGVVLAQDGQDGQSSMGTTDNDSNSDSAGDNDNDSNDNADDIQNADNGQNGDNGQTDQNAAGDNQQIPPTVLGPDSDQGESQQAPQMNGDSQPVNPYQ